VRLLVQDSHLLQEDGQQARTVVAVVVAGVRAADKDKRKRW
jgi:hypothetical protein